MQGRKGQCGNTSPVAPHLPWPHRSYVVALPWIAQLDRDSLPRNANRQSCEVLWIVLAYATWE